MKRSLTIVLAVVAAAMIWRVGGWYRSRPANPEEAIRHTIEATREAAEQKDANAILAFVSRSFEGAGLTYQQMRAMLWQNLKEATNVQVKLSAPQIIVTGDTAVVTFAHATLAYDMRGAPMSHTATNVVVRLHKEPVRRFLVIPDTEWRFIAADPVLAP